METHRFVFRRVDDLGRENHRREGKHVQLRSERKVLVHALRDRLALAPIALVPEERPTLLLGRVRERIGTPAPIRGNVYSDDLMARLRQPIRDVPAKCRLSKNCDSYSHFATISLRASSADSRPLIGGERAVFANCLT